MKDLYICVYYKSLCTYSMESGFEKRGKVKGPRGRGRGRSSRVGTRVPARWASARVPGPSGNSAERGLLCAPPGTGRGFRELFFSG